MEGAGFLLTVPKLNRHGGIPKAPIAGDMGVCCAAHSAVHIM